MKEIERVKDLVQQKAGKKPWLLFILRKKIRSQRPVADGGEHSVSNIATACRQHHQLHHQFEAISFESNKSNEAASLPARRS